MAKTVGYLITFKGLPTGIERNRLHGKLYPMAVAFTDPVLYPTREQAVEVIGYTAAWGRAIRAEWSKRDFAVVPVHAAPPAAGRAADAKGD